MEPAFKQCCSFATCVESCVHLMLPQTARVLQPVLPDALQKTEVSTVRCARGNLDKKRHHSRVRFVCLPYPRPAVLYSCTVRDMNRRTLVTRSVTSAGQAYPPQYADSAERRHNWTFTTNNGTQGANMLPQLTSDATGESFMAFERGGAASEPSKQSAERCLREES